MNEKSIIKSIGLSANFLKDFKLLRSFINNRLLQPNIHFNKIALKSESSYPEIFLTGIQEQYYNFILEDYSYFQFNYADEEDRKNGCHKPYARYAYYPNPFENLDTETGEGEKFDIEKLDFEDYSQILSEYKVNNSKVPIRYDVSFKQYKKIYHPVAHFHFGLGENTRIAADKILSPLSFIAFVLHWTYIDYYKEFKSHDNNFKLNRDHYKSLKDDPLVYLYNDDEDYFCDIQKQLLCIR